MSAFYFSEVDKSVIRNGDVILHNGREMTVNSSDITTGFCGICIFGDSYSLGRKKVLKGKLKVSSVELLNLIEENKSGNKVIYLLLQVF